MTLKYPYLRHWPWLLVIVGIGVLGLIVIVVLATRLPESSLYGMPAGAYNVRDYGATGDGVSDDGPAIAATVKAAGIAPVFFPAGVYFVAHTVYLPKGWRRADWHGQDLGPGFEKQSWLKFRWTYPGGGRQKAWTFVPVLP